MKLLIGRTFLYFGSLFGILFAGIAMYFYAQYLSDIGNSGRSEYLYGVAMGILVACPSWIAASLGVFLVDGGINKVIGRIVYLLAFLSCSSLAYFIGFG